MKKEDIKSKTTEKLEGELKQLKAITWTLMGVLITLFGVLFYGLFTNGSSSNLPLFVVAIACSAILPSQFSNIKTIETELNTRKKANK